ncbi:MAG: TraR/DksA family transcriptional regulator [Thermodesulfobacteriota bacterium]
MLTNETKESIREQLIKKLSDLLDIADETVVRMSKGDSVYPDPLDRALSESNRSIELKKRDRERKLIQKIKEALSRIDEDSYGVCEVCGEYISRERLVARPETTFCISCKEEQEADEKKFG